MITDKWSLCLSVKCSGVSGKFSDDRVGCARADSWWSGARSVQ